ncbi:MAG: hypothetical protein J6R93_07015 [Tidjanibacter sp.]|jgi:hypothetical protein|nr:hypothetical protein [Tidjanibacter sp.]
MGEIDYLKLRTDGSRSADEELLMSEVVKEEHELLYLDTLLREVFAATVL